MTESVFRPFVTGHCVQTIFALFLIACLIGTYWEELLYYIQHRQRVLRTGTVIGPFSPIYGYGVAMFALLLGGADDFAWWQIYLLSCLIGGAMEFFMSLVAEYVFHQVIWDYHKMPLNIMGRTTVPFMLGWGLGGLILLRGVYPVIIRLLMMVPFAVGQPLFIFLLLFMIVNLVLTYSALGRQAMRANGAGKGNAYWAFYDKHYPDEWLKKRFPAITVFSTKDKA